MPNELYRIEFQCRRFSPYWNRLTIKLDSKIRIIWKGIIIGASPSKGHYIFYVWSTPMTCYSVCQEIFRLTGVSVPIAEAKEIVFPQSSKHYIHCFHTHNRTYNDAIEEVNASL